MSAADKELLELAALAAGIELLWPTIKDLSPRRADAMDIWNPRDDDGDTLRLARATGLRIDFNCRVGSETERGIGVWPPGDNSPFPRFWTMYGKNPDADIRQTILRASAAAEIGRAMRSAHDTAISAEKVADEAKTGGAA